MISLIYNFISFALLFSLGIQDGKPEWINNPEKNYPNSQYMTAVGIGDSRKEAENSAASNLSKIFESNIKSEETVNARYQELMKSSNQSSLESQTNINKNISVSSQQTLFNVRYPESYTDNLGRVYVLGVIEREPTAAIYKSKMDDNNSRIAVFVRKYEEQRDPIKRYANIGAALVTAKVNETLGKQLEIIMPGLSFQDTVNSLERITEMCAGAQKEIPFAINISGTQKDDVTGFVSDMLSGLGFPVAAKGVLRIVGNESVEPIDLKNDQMKFVRWSYRVSVFDASGIAIISLSENGREAHLTREEAVARALRTMRDKIKSGLAKKVDSYFDGLVLK